MSYTTIFSFDKTGVASEAAIIENAWRGGMAIWSEMEERHLPPYIPEYVKPCNWYRPGMPYEELVSKNGFRPTRLSPSIGGQTAAQDIFDLTDDPSVSRNERIVLYTTFDKVLVKQEDLPAVIEAFRSFGGTTSLPEQSDVLERLLQDGDCIAVGWDQNSVYGGNWAAYQHNNETGEDIPYNCLTQSEHQWLFDALNDQSLINSYLEKKWGELDDVPFDDPGPECDLVLAEDWWAFKVGTEREDIWHYFDQHHSKGVAYLMHL